MYDRSDANVCVLKKTKIENTALWCDLQITGPCAVPFTIEKQTLLQLSLPVAMKDDLNIYSVKVKEVTRPFNRYWKSLFESRV